jgi:nucleoid DNA-binding protein
LNLPFSLRIQYTGRQAFNLLDSESKYKSPKEDPMAGKRMSKTELVEAVATQSGLEKKQVNAVLDALNNVVYQELKAQNEVMVPGLLKLSTVTKPAVPEREGINPFTKEKTMFKARPERKVIKARPVKALKDAV